MSIRLHMQWVRMGLLLSLLPAWTAARAASVNITIPAAVSFNVTNVTATTTGAPNPFAISFSDGQLDAGSALRISLRANAVNFTPPSGTAIPADFISWTVANAQGGNGFAGTLSAGAFSQVYQSDASTGAPLTGGLDLTFRLASPAAIGLRAGAHTLTATWKVEAIGP